MQILKFGKGNAKLGKEIHTFSLPSGHSCPGAVECLAKADRKTGRVSDGKKQKFRCFSASAEAVFTEVRKSRWRNFTLVRKERSRDKIRDLILKSLPKNAKIIRIHVGGDFYNQTYFDAWMMVAIERSDVLFYAYTKSVDFWAKRLVDLPVNFQLTASLGGKYDRMVGRLQLRTATVVFHPEDAIKRDLEIDHDDSHARSKSYKSFALLIHGTQPKGSEASTALKRMKKEEVQFEYPRK